MARSDTQRLTEEAELHTEHARLTAALADAEQARLDNPDDPDAREAHRTAQAEMFAFRSHWRSVRDAFNPGMVAVYNPAEEGSHDRGANDDGPEGSD